MLFHTINAALGTPAKVRLLRALMPLATPVSGNEARILAGIRSKSGMQAALDELVELGIVERDDARRIRLYRLNQAHDLFEPLKALFQAESRRTARLREALQALLEQGSVREHTLSIILFGSNARGNARPASDLDLLVVADAEPHVASVLRILVDGIPEIRHRLGLRLSPYVLDAGRVRERHRDGDPLMQNVLSEGRTLYGTPFHEIVGAW
ncbi:MAG TPA: nucleotidyltransferase domain-containing protein [Longimicrobium sp.]|nr:nucleotidyltransferase domain-containing protein [Longimicrobium sp.]